MFCQTQTLRSSTAPHQDDDSLKDSISIHVELCKAVLKVFLLTSRNIGDSFTNDTWTVLLKVFLGISECILSEPTAKTLPSVKKDAAVATAITTANGASVNSVGVQIADQIGEDLITVNMTGGVRKIFS